MLKVQRQDELLRLCDARGNVSVADACELLDISPITARRYMDELAADGKVERVRGGAKSLLPVRGRSMEQRHEKKRMQHAGEKHRIAELAAGLIKSGDTIFLGAGTTCELITDHLDGMGVRVVTNSLPAFERLRDNRDIELFLIGGLYREKTSVFYGPVTESALQVINLDKVFFGVNGISGNTVTGHNAEIARLQRLVFDRGRHRYILADSSKFDQKDFYTFYDLSRVDAVITDDGLTPHQLEEYGQYTKIIH